MRLVFLHAFPLDERMWKQQLDIFPGCVETPVLYRLGDSLEEWASGVLRAVGNGPSIVVGASMGGSCTLELARLAGDRIAALVLVGAKAGHRPEPAVRDRYISTLRKEGIMGMWPEMLDQLFGPEPQSHQESLARIREIALDQDIDDLVNAVNVFHNRPDLTDVVRNWKKPLVAVCGTRGSLESPEKAVSIASMAPLGQYRIMNGCGHYMSMERPDEFNAILRDVLDMVA